MNKVIATATAAIFALTGTLVASPTAMASWTLRAAQSIERSHEIPLTAFAPNTSYAVCFTPGQDCEGLIVSEISHARKSILIQAYSFTSTPIAKALVQAKQRGIDVRVILDKSQRSERYTGATYLLHAGIPLAIDEKPAIAHSKVFIFDQETVLTGSFNFTRAAQTKNAENLIVIKGDQNLVRLYTGNWVTRWNVSVPM